MKDFILLLVACGLLISGADAAPRIGLIYRLDQARSLEKESNDPLVNYRRAIANNGGEIVAMSCDLDGEELKKRIDSLDGLLVPGGDDVDPAYWGEKPDAKIEVVDKEFDRFEMELLNTALRRKWPVLAICRGEQIYNVFRGGTLIQDIPTHVKASKPVVHRIKVDGKLQPCDHEITIEEGSLMHWLTGKTRMRVNSSHHQAVGRVGKGLRVTARADDGVVEAIEAPGPVFFLGVQFHPEKDLPKDPSMNQFFTEFLKAAEKARPINKVGR